LGQTPAISAGRSRDFPGLLGIQPRAAHTTSVGRRSQWVPVPNRDIPPSGDLERGHPRESPFERGLVSGADVTVETIVGTLRRLPAAAPATFAGGVAGEVRVVWPAPIDTAEVRKSGTDTVPRHHRLSRLRR
jgi:hypothetical protein